MGTEHHTMSSAPVYSRNLNGMMVGAYSNADLRKMVQADKAAGCCGASDDGVRRAAAAR